MDTKSKEPKSEHEAKYKELRPRYEKLAEEIQYAINKRLEDEDIKVDAVTHRAKTIDSFLEKIERKPYDDPLKEITDLAGVRVVCLYESDLQKVEDIVRTKFEVEDEEDKRDDLGTDKMGYQGKHFVVELGSGYSGDRYEGLHGLRCEIQVRTVLQDAWAIISHHLVYKNEASIPDRLRRDVNNVAAMLEVAQGVFDKVREKRDGYIEEIQQKSDDRSSFLSQPVNFDTLAAYTKWKYTNLEISEFVHGIMIDRLNLSKYQSLQDIDDIVNAASPAVEAFLKAKPSFPNTGTTILLVSFSFLDMNFRKMFGWPSEVLKIFEKYEHLIRTKQ